MSGKVALVTGGSRGIGAAVVRRLAREGTDVAVGFVRDEARAQAVVDDLREVGVRARHVCADVSDPTAIAKMIHDVVEWSGGQLDYLVCCAGIEQFKSLDCLTADDFDRIFHTNTRGMLLTTVACLEHMPAGSAIVWTSSVSASRAVDRHALYAGSKAAVEAMARQVAGELAPRGIRINVVAPGGTYTDMAAEHAGNYLKRALVGRVPGDLLADVETALGRWAEPEEIASTIAFLLGEDARYMTGATLPVDGGFR